MLVGQGLRAAPDSGVHLDMSKVLIPVEPPIIIIRLLPTDLGELRVP